jgi:hypothetical protein
MCFWTAAAACWRAAARPVSACAKAQKARITPQTTLNMAQLCKDQAAVRYNANAAVDVSHFEQFPGEL